MFPAGQSHDRITRTATATPVLRPGWCVLHGLMEPCSKCNLPYRPSHQGRYRQEDLVINQEGGARHGA